MIWGGGREGWGGGVKFCIAHHQISSNTEASKKAPKLN